MIFLLLLGIDIINKILIFNIDRIDVNEKHLNIHPSLNKLFKKK